LQNSLNIVQTPAAKLSHHILEIIVSLLYAPTSSIQKQLENPLEKLRGGITFKIGDETLRLVKDFNNHTISLSQFKKEQNNFVEISREEKFILQLLQTRHKLPSPMHYQSLFCVGGEKYQERLSQYGGVKSEHSKTGQEYFGVLDESSSGSESDRLKRLSELKKQLQQLEQIQSLEDKLDDLQRQSFEKEEVLTRFKEKENSIQGLEKQFHSTLQGTQNIAIPDDIKIKIEKYTKAGKDRTNDLNKLENKAEKLTQELLQQSVQPIQKNMFIIGGLATFLLATILTVKLSHIRHLLLPGIVIAIGVVAYGFFHQLSRQEKHRRLKQQLDQLDHEKKSLEKKYEIEMSVVLHLMKRLQVKDPNDILEIIQEREQAGNSLKAAKDDIANLKKSLNIEQVQQEHQKLQLETNEVRKKMERFTGANFDPLAIRQEIEALESSMGVAHHSAAVSTPMQSDPLGDPLQKLVTDSSALLKISPNDLLQKIKTGLETNLVAISSRKLAEPVYVNGKISGVTTGKGGKVINIHELPAAELFFLYFALQFTLLQVLNQNANPLPIIWADLPSVANDALSIIYKAFKHLSGMTQIICLTQSQPLLSLQKPDITI
jgi:Mg2+ and Co2+ transporter CorA